MTLLDMLSVNGRFKRVARTNGGEWAGPCPFCGGRDRFRVWPNEDSGRFWCRGCGKHGDSIDYLREMRGLTFQEACLELGIDPATRWGNQSHRQIREQGFIPRETTLPPECWQRKAGSLLTQAKWDLWKNQNCLTWLQGRGLSEETIRAAGLGWNAVDLWENRETWGLDPVKDEKGKVKELWFPAGLVIPYSIGGMLLRLRIRRPQGEPRYVIVSGSDTRPMIFHPERKCIVVVESEIDGLLIDQEAGDLVGGVALGTAQAKPDEETHKALNRADLILVSLDSDKAGAKSSWEFWLRSYDRARRWPCPIGKDPSDAFQKGLNIRAWVKAALTDKTLILHSERSSEATVKPFPKEWLKRFDEMQLERLAIMTIDGRLSDQEAVRLLN